MTPSLRSRFVSELPGDPDRAPHSRPVHGACWSPVHPTPVSAPRLLAFSDEVREQLGLSVETLRSPAFVEALAGNRLLPGSSPYAANYGGHQFGHWAGQLGDGRAIGLGELVDRDGVLQELQLKGAGPTPYSRHADGRAVLRSSVREFLCSEAMAHLGVPTTRALALVTTGDRVVRDPFYDGRPRAEPGAIVTRVAPSFVRFGSFELPASRRDRDTLGRLVAHTIGAHFPGLGDPSAPTTVVAWLEEVSRRTAALTSRWLALGFVHGVMNTDNLSILGLTLDYGPYGWLEVFDPDWTPNTTDAGQGRYRWSAQPQVAGWNLCRLLEAVAPLVGDPAPLQEVLDGYAVAAEREQRARWAEKLALSDPDGHDALLSDLFVVLRVVETDLTLWFRELARVVPDPDDARLLAPLAPAFHAVPDAAQRARLAGWVRAWLAVTEPDPARRRRHMDRHNPRYILRNWLAQGAIDRAEAGDPGGVEELLEVLRRPYDDQPGREAFAVRRPDWARDRAGCSRLSCSS